MAEKNKNNNSLVFADDGYLSYIDFSKLSFADKLRRRLNIAKVQFDNGSLAKAGYALVGGYDPENPRLSTGDVPNPGMRNPRLIVQGTLKIKQVVQKAKTIAERAAKISDRIFDRQYQRAISSGNSKRVLAVRDLHFKGKTGNDLVLTTYRSLLSNKRIKSQGLNPYNDTRHTVKHEGYFSTSSKDIANTYKVEEESPIFELYPYMKNPYVTDVNGRSWQAVEIYHPEEFPHLTYGRTTDLVIRRILSEGNNDGVIFRNIMDVGPKRVNLNGASEIADDYVTFPGKAKLKDAIIYDNNGNIIPISQRDNFLINDIRYKQGGKMNVIERFKNGGQIRKMQTASGGPITRYETLPNIVVEGYIPLKLKTYKPLHKDYPFTGHSSLDIPIDEDSAYTQGWYSPYGISVDKTSKSKDYNLVTNNCADATLGALNYIFGTNEKPFLFTTPGDVRDYAINKLHGKVTRDKDGIDTILIPRNKNNAKEISKRALEWKKNKDEDTIYEYAYKQGGMLEFLKNGSGIHIKKKNKGKFTSYCGGKVTDECILKGKNSSNPAIRKRATFAANARKWKHLEGGIIKAQTGVEVPNPNATGGVYRDYINYLLNWIPKILELLRLLKLMDDQLEILKSQLTSNMMLDLFGIASNYIMNNLGGLSKIFSKKSTTDNGSPSTTTSMYKLSDFWSNPTIANSLT